MKTKVKMDRDEKTILSLLMFIALVMVIVGSYCIVLNYQGIKTGTDPLSSFTITGLGLFFGLVAYLIYEHLKKGATKEQENVIEQ